MQVAVVLLNYNGKELLKQFLPTLINNTPNAILYLADNASTDDSILYCRENFPQIKIISLVENFGYAKGYNEALKHVQEEYLCLLNTDVEVTSNWLTPVINLFNFNNKIGIIQPKILDYKKKDTFEYAGAAGGFIDKYGFPYCRGRVFDTIEKDLNQYPSDEIFWASGACFFVRNSVFKKLNGFDEDFFAHQEEIDFCWRAFNENIKVYYCAESTVYHVGGATLNKANPRKTFLNFRNSLYMLYKNVPEKDRFKTIFNRLCLDGLAGIYLFCKLKPLHTLAIVRAHFAYYSHLKKLKNKTSINNKKTYYTLKNITFTYFLNGKKKFDQLNSK